MNVADYGMNQEGPF